MSETTRQEMIQKYREGYRELKNALKKIPKEAWDFRPAESEWTIKEIVAHVADAEAHAYIRLRTLFAEPGEIVKPYNQTAYAEKLGYSNQDPELSMKLFKALVKGNYALLGSLPENIEDHKITHPEHGEWNIDSWLESYVNHAQGHIQQIKRNLDKMTTEKSVG